MNPALAASYASVTEHPGQRASQIQLSMLEARYRWAAAQARGKDILEAGCGAGMGLPPLADVARSVQAGDVDAGNLRAAESACAGYANVALRTFDAQELPFSDESFDVVLLFEAIYYLPDARRFLEEAWRVLRPAGRLLIVTVNPEWSGFNPSPFSTRYLSGHNLLYALREAGFATRVEGAFPESSGAAAAIFGMVRRVAIALELIPRTMRGKAWLKRIFYGRLQPVPLQLAAVSVRGPVLKLLDDGDPARSRYRVLYVTAYKP